MRSGFNGWPTASVKLVSSARGNSGTVKFGRAGFGSRWPAKSIQKRMREMNKKTIADLNPIKVEPGNSI